MPDAGAELDRAAADIPLTRSAREILDRAAATAKARGGSPTARDILLAALSTRGTPAEQAIRSLGADPAAIASQLSPVEDSGPATVPLRQLLVNANREAQVLGHYHVDSIHILLALLYSDSPETSGPLQKAGLTMYDLRRHLQAGTRADFQPGESDRASASRTQPAPAAGRARSQSPTSRIATHTDAALRRKPWPSLRGAISVSPVFLALVGATAASGALLWFRFLPAYLGVELTLFVVVGWITSVCVHEFAHALVAYIGGDGSVRDSGYLDLNPLRYTNILLSLIMPVLFLLLGGIALPGGAVYINRSALRSRSWDSAVSAAGPAGTLLCALLVAIPFLIPGHTEWMRLNPGLYGGLAALVFFEALAFVLNLIPVPGLDGFGIIRPWLPYSFQGFANQYGQLGIIAVFAVLWFVAPASQAFFQAVLQITDLFGIDRSFIGFGLSQFYRFR